LLNKLADNNGLVDGYGLKVGLEYFISLGKGVCRHQALLAAYLIEKQIQQGNVKGKVSIDSNFITHRGGHAWVRFKDANNQVFVLDPTNENIGQLDQVDSNPSNPEGWSYKRPEDKNPVKKLLYSILRRAGFEIY
jgi:hypothetical protein